MKQTFLGLLVLVILILFSSCGSTVDYPTYDEIFDLVSTNKALLEKVVQERKILPDSVVNISTTERLPIYDSAYKDIIGLYVCIREDNNYIYQSFENDVFEDLFRLDWIRQVSTLYSNETKIDCGGSGVGSGISYYGFFYVSAGNPEDVSHLSGKVEKYGSGQIVREPDGDNSFFYCKITDGFYYFTENY